MIKLSKIKFNKSNPRFIKGDKFDKLKKSIQEFPKMMELRPIIIDDDNVVLGGNMRLKALLELGFTEVSDTWIRVASELSEEEKKQFIIKDNVGFGEWDYDILANEWEVEDLESWGLDMASWNVQEVDDINEIDDFNESVNFIIKCKDLKEKELLQSKLGVQSERISYEKFIEMTGL